MQCVQCVPRDGLGFPIVPIIMGASAVAGLFMKKKTKLTEADAKKLVQQIYLELLEREPDPGAQGYIDCLIKGAQHDPNKGWCDVDFIRTELLKSPEYRDLQVLKAQQAYGLAPGAAPGLAPGAPGALPQGGYPPTGGIPGEIFGIPLIYVAGAVALLMLMRR